MHYISSLLLSLLTSSLPLLADPRLLLLRSEQGGTDQVGSSTKLDTDDPLHLGEQLLVWHSTSRLDISDLCLSTSFSCEC